MFLVEAGPDRFWFEYNYIFADNHNDFLLFIQKF